MRYPCLYPIFIRSHSCRFLEYPCKMLGILKIKNDGLNISTR